MKLKNIKLLKTLAFTGALGLVAAVPIITATACSTDTSNSGGNSSDSNGSGSGSGSGSDTGTNNGGSSGGSSSGGTDNGGSGSGSDNGNSGGTTGGGDSGGGSTGGSTDTTTKVTPILNDKISFVGGLEGIYDQNNKTSTNDLLAKAIESNPSIAFKNSDDLKNKDIEVTVDAGFPTESSWSGKNYDGDQGWRKGTFDQKVLYNSSLPQLSVSSLSDLKSQLNQDEIIKILDAANIKYSNTTYEIQNMPGLINDDLIHVNVLGTQGKKTFNIDLQIPTSDINLDVKTCKISVKGNNEINELSNGTSELTYNIGVDSNTHYIEGTTPTISASDVKDATKALNALGLTKNATTLDNDKIASALGVYNCTFASPTIQEKASSISLVEGKEGTETNNNKTYTITLTATLNSTDNYVWTDGSKDSKNITFDAVFSVN